MYPLNLTERGSTDSFNFFPDHLGFCIINECTLEEIRFWLAGSLAGRDAPILFFALPFVIIGLVIAFALGRQITTMNSRLLYSQRFRS